MKITVHERENLSPDQVDIDIFAHPKNMVTDQLVTYLHDFSADQKTLSVTDRQRKRQVQVPLQAIVSAEVHRDFVTIVTTQTILEERIRFYQVLEDLDTRFVQISKSVAINLDYLKELTSTNNGLMMAQMKNEQQFSISRRYLKNLKATLEGES